MDCEGCLVTETDFVRLSGDDQRLKEWLQRHGAYPVSTLCPKCGKPCSSSDSNGNFRCNKSSVQGKRKRSSCNYSVSKLKGTFFEGSRLSVEQVSLFVLYWLWQPPPRQSFYEQDMGLSSKTVVDWSSFCREVCVYFFADSSEAIGGPGSIVEINEAKIGKLKCNRGLLVDVQWVFSGYDRGSKKVFLVPVQTGNKDTLLELIREFILPGTAIYSDCWKAYDCLNDEGYSHLTVNHSLNFVDSESGAHTRHIRNVGYLAESLFKRKYPDFRERMHYFFRAVGRVYPPLKLRLRSSQYYTRNSQSSYVNLLPEKSMKKSMYLKFMEWRADKRVKSYSETVLVAEGYIDESISHKNQIRTKIVQSVQNTKTATKESNYGASASGTILLKTKLI